MNQVFEQRLGALQAHSGVSVAGGRRGVEKESLRVTSDGYLAQTPHPDGLGSALTNHFITTDFSEALLEFVTPALDTTWEALQVVCDIHQFAYQQLGELAGTGTISPRTLLILSYALCGFTHVASVGIFVGGVAALAPSRRDDLAGLGLRALAGATLATLMTGALAGLFYHGQRGLLGL